jgi:hypothetical protein
MSGSAYAWPASTPYAAPTAVHLASLFAVGGVETVFAAWDQRLRAGAHTAGVRLAPAP